MACTASRGWSKVTVPIPRLLPSLSSLTSARLTSPAMPNTSFNFFQPTLKSNCKKQESTLFMMSFKGNFSFLRNPHIGHKYCVAQTARLQRVDDFRRDIGVVSNGRRDVHSTITHVLPPTALLPSSQPLQHTPSVFSIGILKQE